MRYRHGNDRARLAGWTSLPAVAAKIFLLSLTDGTLEESFQCWPTGKGKPLKPLEQGPGRMKLQKKFLL